MKWRNVALAACLMLAGAAGACADDPTAQQLSALPTDPDQVVAEVGGRKITLKELDAKWEQFDAAERARVTQLLYQNRRNMLDQVVGEILVENAAKAANLPVDQFLAEDAARRQQPVTEAEIAQFYEQNKQRAQGRTLEDLRGQIKDFLEAQRKQQARAQLVEELAAKSGGGVKVMLDPPRYTVALTEHDPIRGEATAPVTLVEFSDYQ